MRRILALTVLLLLLTPAALAAGEGYPDLPPGHWAYSAMTEAAEAGILTGYEDGTMHPEADLSWGQWLVMLGRAFYAPTLEAQSAEASLHWAAGAYFAAREADVLDGVDFLPVSLGGLDLPVTRQDAAVLLDRVFRNVLGEEIAVVEQCHMAATDWESLPEPYRAPVLQCYARAIITGYEDGRFGGGDVLSRAAAAALLMRCSPPPAAQSTTPPPPAQSATPPSPAPPEGGLKRVGCNDEKLVRLYGTAAVRRYPSRAEAEACMVNITVPVWHLSGATGAKEAATCTFRANAALEGDLTEIFAEIYNDAERFPIHTIGGYDWRGDAAAGEHNCGTALDINPDENYQIYPDGRVGAGSHWLPGEDPLSLPEAGSVVRIFAAHGYTWGGNAWDTNRDYMHFSYLGE